MEPLSFGIKIKTLDNALHEMNISPEMTVGNLKTLIEDKMKVPIPKQRLIFHGKLLNDSEKLSTYKIEEGHVLHLVANPLDPSTSPTHQPSEQTGQRPTTNPNNDIDILTGIIRTINQTSVNRRNQRRRLLQQRSFGFNMDKKESLSVIKQSFHSISMLLDNTTKHNELNTIKKLNKDTFINPFNFSNRKLHLGQWIDVKDTIDQWLEAQVIKVQNNQVYIHYNGWGTRWDEWLDMNSPRIALFRTYTVQSSHSLYMSPSPINQPDGDIVEELNEASEDISEYLFDLGSLLSKVTADIIELGKIMNLKKISEKKKDPPIKNNFKKSSFSSSSSNEEEEEFKANFIHHEENTIPAEVKVNLISSQLAPIFDRVGRLLIDMAPHLALKGSGIQTIFLPSTNNIVTNVMSPSNEEHENLQKTHVFQIPVMLTPGELLSSNNPSERNNFANEEFPRTIIIGSRNLSENLHENLSAQLRSEDQERSFAPRETENVAHSGGLNANLNHEISVNSMENNDAFHFTDIKENPISENDGPQLNKETEEKNIQSVKIKNEEEILEKENIEIEKNEKLTEEINEGNMTLNIQENNKNDILEEKKNINSNEEKEDNQEK